VFLDVSQAFDRVWHPGLLYKIKKTSAIILPTTKNHILAMDNFESGWKERFLPRFLSTLESLKAVS